PGTGSVAARPAAAERPAAALVPTGPLLRPGGAAAGRAPAVQVVRGETLVAPGHLVRLTPLPYLVDRAALGHPRLLLGPGPARPVVPDPAAAQGEHADQQGQHHHRRDRQPGAQGTTARREVGRLHP